MIENHEQFEAALERAADLLASPPQPGTEQHRGFMTLLEAIHRYRPPAEAAEEETRAHAEALAALGEQLAEFSDSLKADRPEGSMSRFGFGKDLGGD